MKCIFYQRKETDNLMTGKTIKCCNCAGVLDIPEGVNKIFCLYCGTPNLLTDVLEIPGVGLKCLSCGIKNKNESIYCSKCGTKLQEKCICCGEMHTHDTTYCVKTGRNIMDTKAEITIKMIFIHGGTFQMGSNTVNDEKPIHSVTVNSFYMGKYPVTNKKYKLFKPEHKGKWSEPDYPVETLNWYDMIKYCNWLSDKEGLDMCYSESESNIKMDISKNGYRLPTEAEWEYACRAGTTTDYYWGDIINGDYCWYYDNSNNTIHSVGQKKPNEFGLYDMSGNVWEWCWDWYGHDYYKVSPSDNPAGPAEGLVRVVRGGGLDYYSATCRSACRHTYGPDGTDYRTGFRPVRSAL